MLHTIFLLNLRDARGFHQVYNGYYSSKLNVETEYSQGSNLHSSVRKLSIQKMCISE